MVRICCHFAKRRRLYPIGNVLLCLCLVPAVHDLCDEKHRCRESLESAGQMRTCSKGSHITFCTSHFIVPLCPHLRVLRRRRLFRGMSLARVLNGHEARERKIAAVTTIHRNETPCNRWSHDHTQMRTWMGSLTLSPHINLQPSAE